MNTSPQAQNADDLAPTAASVDESTEPPIKRMAGVLVFTVLALVALLLSPWRGGAMFAYFGIVPGLLALHMSWRAALISALATAGAVFMGVWVSGSVLWSVVWMTALAFGVGATSLIGWAGVASMIAAQSAIVVVSGKIFPLAPAPFDVPHTAAGALPVAAFALGGGLVMTVAAALFLRGFERPASPRLDKSDASWYTATVVGLTLVGTWICQAFFPGTHAWWLLLTIFVVLLPIPDEASNRMHDRAIGTAIGAVGVIVFTALFGVHPQIYRFLAIAAIIGVIATTSKSYTTNAALITVTVLLMASPGAHNVLLLQSERIALTLAGVLVTWGLMVGLAHLRARLTPANS